MPNVCGSPFLFTSSTLYPTNNLYVSSVAKQTNLTRTPVISKANQPFSFTKKEMSSASHTPNCASNITSSLQTNSSSPWPTVRPNCTPLQNVVRGNLDKADKLSENPCQSNVVTSDIPRTENSKENPVPQRITEASVTKPYVPCFTSRKSVKELPKTLCKSGRSKKEKPLVPCFKKADSKNKSRNSKVVKISAKGGVDRDWQRADCSGANDVSRGRLSLSLNKRHVVVTADKTMKTSLERTVDNSDGNTLCLASQFPGQRWPLDTLKEPSELQLMKKTKEKDKAIVDVRKMVAENKLSKVSAASITKWLKSEGVKCRCKEKKQDLMLKVYQYLDLKQPEQ